MRIVLSTLAICAVSMFLNACNTVDGAGQDIAAGGHGISHAAEKVQNGQ